MAKLKKTIHTVIVTAIGTVGALLLGLGILQLLPDLSALAKILLGIGIIAFGGLIIKKLKI